MGKFDKLGKIIKVVGSSGDETAKALAAAQKAEPQLQRYFQLGDKTFPAVDPEKAKEIKRALELTGQVGPGRSLVELGNVDPQQFNNLRKALAPEAEKLSHQIADPESFYQSLEKARASDPRIQEYTHLYSPEEYGQMKTFLAPDQMSGVAVKPDGDIVSAFNAQRGSKRLDDIMRTAEEAGGNKLDAFDKKPGEEKGLPDLYKRYGYDEVKREPNWTPGGPDVVYMQKGKKK